VPILVYLFGQDPVTATGLSLFIVGTTSAAGIFSHHKQGNIEWQTAAVFGAASMLSVFITRRWLVPALPDPLMHLGNLAVGKGEAILALFAVVMLLSSLSMIRSKHLTATAENGRRHLPSLLLIGLLVGLLTGVPKKQKNENRTDLHRLPGTRRLLHREQRRSRRSSIRCANHSPTSTAPRRAVRRSSTCWRRTSTRTS
jgi:hypothetical protein